MRFKLHYSGFFVLAALFIVACAQLDKMKDLTASSVQEKSLEAKDVNPQLGDLKENPIFEKVITKEKLTYLITDNPKYNSFFKEVAIVHGGFAVGNVMVDDANKHLKNYARSFISTGAIKGNIKEIMDAPNLDEMTKSLKLIELRKKEGELTEDELTYFSKTVGDLAFASEGLKESKDSILKLIPQAQGLMSSVESDFSTAPLDAQKVMDGLQGSMDKLKKVKDEAQPLLKNLTVLVQSFQGFIADP